MRRSYGVLREPTNEDFLIALSLRDFDFGVSGPRTKSPVPRPIHQDCQLRLAASTNSVPVYRSRPHQKKKGHAEARPFFGGVLQKMILSPSDSWRGSFAV